MRQDQERLPGSDAHALACGLAFVLAEGLRHIAERRAKAATRRSTMRVRRPAPRTMRTMPDPRPAARTRPRTRIRRSSVASR